MLKSSHRMAKRFCSSALALLLLVPGSLLASAEETDSTDGAAGISNTGTQGEYFQYLSESGGKAYAGDDILLPLEQAVLSDAVAAVSHLDKDALKFALTARHSGLSAFRKTACTAFPLRMSIKGAIAKTARSPSFWMGKAPIPRARRLNSAGSGRMPPGFSKTDGATI